MQILTHIHPQLQFFIDLHIMLQFVVKIRAKTAGSSRIKNEYIGMTDLLTGLLSRHQLHIALPELVAQSKPAKPVTLLLIKLRDFELWQGRLTPLAADHLLQITANIIKEMVPKTAMCARWSNATFAMLLPATPTWQAESLAEDIQDYAASSKLPAIFEYQGMALDFCYGAASSPPTEYTRLPAMAEDQLRHAECGIFSELLLSAPPLPDNPTMNAYIHLASRYLAAGDPYLRRHGQMTAAYAIETAHRLGFSPFRIKRIKNCSIISRYSYGGKRWCRFAKTGTVNPI